MGIVKKFPCDIEKKTAYVYSCNNCEKLEKEMQIYEKLGISAHWKEHLPISIEACGAIGMEEQAQYNPMKLLAALTQELEIYENTNVTEIKENKAFTDKGTIKADRIILATHFPMINIPGGYFVKMYQEESYAAAIKNGKQIDGMYIDENKDGFSFRNYEDYLLVGGGNHKTGTKKDGYEVLKNLIIKAYPDKKISYMWSTQDCMTLDGIPYIGKHSKSHDKILVATGFNKWGMTGAMSAAIVLEELIKEGKSRYEELFSPQRSMLHAQILVNLGSAVGNILRPGKRCTHMGCALKWNKQERTWDCPCHGSKFESNGDVLENPAKRKIKIR